MSSPLEERRKEILGLLESPFPPPAVAFPDRVRCGEGEFPLSVFMARFFKGEVREEERMEAVSLLKGCMRDLVEDIRTAGGEDELEGLGRMALAVRRALLLLVKEGGGAVDPREHEKEDVERWYRFSREL